MRFMLVMSCVGLAFAISTAVEPSWAQTQGGKQTETASSLKPAPVRSDRVVNCSRRAMSTSRTSNNCSASGGRRAAGRRTASEDERVVGAGTRHRTRGGHGRRSRGANARESCRNEDAIEERDVLLAEALIEADAEESTRKLRPSSAPRVVNTVRTTAYIRYGGVRAWSLSEAAVIKEFFIRRFGRALPIGAFGQSALHNRWGYDHRNAMDIGVNPGSNEGQALMEYLRANGIPFTAFHFAVPGKATGPHIHIGLPSHRIAPTWLAVNAGNISRQ